MNFFNLDLHIGVIGDVRRILTDLGHTVSDWTLSGHSWATGRARDPVEVINHLNWKEIDQEMCDAFYDRYKAELDRYDAFIVTHTPCFATLYEKWNKPIIVVASTRYEHPFTGHPKKWNRFNEFLRDGIDRNMIIPLANNKYDAAYTSAFTEREWNVIPSICEYTHMAYQPTKKDFIYWSKFELKAKVPNLISKESLAPGLFRRLANRIPLMTKKHGFDWSDIAAYKGIVHIPYNISVMSIFEQYTASIPLFFPTKRLLIELMKQPDSGALSEISFNQVFGLGPGSRIEFGSEDPNDFTDSEVMSQWIDLADFYDAENMPHLTYFDSLEEIPEVLRSADLYAVSQEMKEHNQKRKENVYTAWDKVVARVK